MKWCCVPDCSKVYKQQAEPREPLHMFRVPRDPALLAKWRRLVPNKISPSSSICHQHFGEQFIRKFDSFLINGERVLLAKDRWTLCPDAVPHIFPTLPAHYSREMKRRKPPKSRPLPSKQSTSTNGTPSSSGSSPTESRLVSGSCILPLYYRKNLITSPELRPPGPAPTLADATGGEQTVVGGPRLSDAVGADGLVTDAVAEADERVKAAALRDLKNTRARMRLELKLKNLRRKYYGIKKSANRLLVKNLRLVAAAKDAKLAALPVSRAKPQKVTLSARQERLAKVRRFSVEDLPSKPRVIVEAIFRKYRLEAENKRSGVRYHPEFIKSAIAFMRETPMGYRHCLKHELLPLPTVSLLRQIQRKREKDATLVANNGGLGDTSQGENANASAVDMKETAESAMVLSTLAMDWVTVETHEEIVS